MKEVVTLPARDRVLVAALLVSAICWMARSHWETIEYPEAERAATLHADVLANKAGDPYQYKLYFVSHALETFREATGWELADVFRLNTLLALLLLVWCHHLWLRTYVSPLSALGGGLLLAAMAGTLFRTYFHHPYEFWGVAGYCILLRGIAMDADWRRLSLGCLILGFVWEKHALLAPLWGLWTLQRKRPFLPSVGRGLVMFACALAVPLLVRWYLGDNRVEIDGDVPLSAQKWMTVAWYQGPYVLPFLFVLLLSWRTTPYWVRWLWLYLPVLAAAYAASHFNLHEVRSLWPLAPVFTVTAACWWSLRPAQKPVTPSGGPDP